jgi:type II secretory pathway component PulJ
MKVICLKSKKGFSLIEIVAMLGILSIFLAATTMILTTAHKLSTESSHREQAHRYASEAIFLVKNYIEKKKEESMNSTQSLSWLGDLENLDSSTSFVLEKDNVYPNQQSQSGLSCGNFLPLRETISFDKENLSSGCFRERQIANTIFREYIKIQKSENQIKEIIEGIKKNTIDENGKELSILSDKSFVVVVTAFVTWKKEKDSNGAAEEYVKASAVLTNHDFK